MTAILETQNLTKRFGGLVAVDDVSLQVKENSIHSLIGPNGAGKTTFFNLLCGLIAVTSGRVHFKGKEITGLPLHRVARLGIGRSFQRTQIFPELTVLENLRVAAQTRQRGRLNPLAVPRPADESHRIGREVMSLVGLTQRADDKASLLSHGEQRALEVGIALATKPSLLLLDEPTSGMSSAEVSAMTDLITRMREQLSVTILLVEHNINLVMAISDLITVLHQGRVIAHGPPNRIKTDEGVIRAYLGGYVSA